MNSDELARMRAATDQGREALKEFAGSCWAFYVALADQGFQPAQALILTERFLVESFRMSHEDSGDE